MRVEQVSKYTAIDTENVLMVARWEGDEGGGKKR